MLDYYEAWLSHIDLSPEKFAQYQQDDSWSNLWPRGTISGIMATHAGLLDYVDRRKEAQALRKVVTEDYVHTQGYHSTYFHDVLTDYIVRALKLFGDEEHLLTLRQEYLTKSLNPPA